MVLKSGHAVLGCDIEINVAPENHGLSRRLTLLYYGNRKGTKMTKFSMTKFSRTLLEN